ncbi:MAG: histidine phosphatase family protein [Burkholderiales bacterium]
MAESLLILIRHGETEWNRAGRIQGYNADSPLTETGHAQAHALAARLAREGVDALFSSDAGRTRQTVAPIAAATGLPVVFDAALRERNYGVFEGRTFAEIERDFPAEYEKLRSRDPHHAASGGESAARFRDRVTAALAAIAGRTAGRRIAVVTHGGVLGIMHRLAHGMPLYARRDYALHNASLNTFRYAAGRWTLESWGDVSHLPAASLDQT